MTYPHIDIDDEPDEDAIARVESLRRRHADLDLRERTAQDSTRAQEPPSYKPPRIVASWPCRACSKPVDVPAEAVELLAMFNAELARRDETPIGTDRIVFCDGCVVEFRRTAPQRRRGQVDRMAPVIRQLKESENPERERALIKQLEAWGHPDLEGLVKACEDRVRAQRASGRRRVSTSEVIR